MKSFFKSVLSTVVGMFIGTLLSCLCLAAIAGLIFKSAQHGSSTVIEKNSILHLKLRGQIVEKHRPLDFQLFGDRSIFTEDRTLGLFELNQAIDLAKDDKRISGIYLELRGLDAGWASLTALRAHLEDFAKSGKWINAYGDRFDEKEYYLATTATQIYLQPNGEIEFNGFETTSPFLKGLFDKLDLQPRIFRVGRFKAAVEPLILDKMSDENRRQNQDLLDDIWATFRTAVATARKMDEKRVDEIAANLQAVSADDAKSTGLVQELIFEDEVEARMKKATVGEDEELQLVTAGQLLHDHSPSKSGKGKKIALIFAEGEIGSGVGGRDSVGSESFRQDVEDALADEDVGAIVVRVNSPGGDALASDVMWRELMVADEEVPVVISMGDVAASGGYYMSAGGRYIFAEPTTITGSIGVFGVMFNTEKFFKTRTGVNFDRVVTHPHADIGNMNRPMSEMEAKSIQGEVNRVYKRFLDVVQEGRGYEKREDLESIAEGRVWSGTRAKDIGLVDELGGLDQALAKAAEFGELGKDFQIETFPKDSDPFMQFIDRFSGDTSLRVLTHLLGREKLEALQSLVTTLPPIQKSGVYVRLPFDLRIY